MTHRLTTNCAKNYCNRTIIVKDIVENVVTFFWDTVYVITIHQRHRQTDGQTDRRHAMAIPRFALKCIAR